VCYTTNPIFFLFLPLSSLQVDRLILLFPPWCERRQSSRHRSFPRYLWFWRLRRWWAVLRLPAGFGCFPVAVEGGSGAPGKALAPLQTEQGKVGKTLDFLRWDRVAFTTLGVITGASWTFLRNPEVGYSASILSNGEPAGFSGHVDDLARRLETGADGGRPSTFRSSAAHCANLVTIPQRLRVERCATTIVGPGSQSFGMRDMALDWTWRRCGFRAG